jgi:hypothetical protein
VGAAQGTEETMRDSLAAPHCTHLLGGVSRTNSTAESLGSLLFFSAPHLSLPDLVSPQLLDPFCINGRVMY